MNLLWMAATFALSGMTAVGATCESLTELKLPNTKIASAQLVTEGVFNPPGGLPIKDLPAFCRVAGVIQPSSDSNIQFEVWMPATGWNGKYICLGNGGFAGSLSYGGLGAPLKHGYAAATTDTGHTGGDASWAAGHPEKLIDYGYRGIHEMTGKAKAIVAAFYGSAPKRSYFASCSNGGRQRSPLIVGPILMEAICSPFVETAKDPIESADYLAPG
jgi:Tannase and feruloyl esterase